MIQPMRGGNRRVDPLAWAATVLRRREGADSQTRGEVAERQKAAVC
jgi:hypothetical protein